MKTFTVLPTSDQHPLSLQIPLSCFPVSHFNSLLSSNPYLWSLNFSYSSKLGLYRLWTMVGFFVMKSLDWLLEIHQRSLTNSKLPQYCNFLELYRKKKENQIWEILTVFFFFGVAILKFRTFLVGFKIFDLHGLSPQVSLFWLRIKCTNTSWTLEVFHLDPPILNF